MAAAAAAAAAVVVVVVVVVVRASARRSSLKERERAIVSQTNIETVSKETLGKRLRDRWSAYGLLRAYRYHLALTDLNCCSSSSSSSSSSGGGGGGCGCGGGSSSSRRKSISSICSLNPMPVGGAPRWV